MIGFVSLRSDQRCHGFFRFFGMVENPQHTIQFTLLQSWFKSIWLFQHHLLLQSECFRVDPGASMREPTFTMVFISTSKAQCMDAASKEISQCYIDVPLVQSAINNNLFCYSPYLFTSGVSVGRTCAHFARMLLLIPWVTML